MNDIPASSEQIRRLVGRQASYQGLAWQVIDYLSDDQELVLEHLGRPAIQADQHGHGRRRAPKTLSIPLYDGQGHWHPEFVALNIEIPRHD